jgi:hypothetical protein
MCLRLDDLVQWHGLPFPSHLKIDVDGGELEVLDGARAVLADPRCRGVQVEVVDQDDTHDRSRSVVSALTRAGLREAARFTRKPAFPQVTDLQFVRP